MRRPERYLLSFFFAILPLWYVVCEPKLLGGGRRAFVRLRAAQAEAADAALVGFEDFDVEPAQVEPRARRRDAPRLVDDEARDGREVVVLDFEAEQALYLPDLGRAEHIEVAVVRLDDLDNLLALDVLVLYLADDLFEDVLDGQQARKSPVLVYDERELDVHLLHLFEQLVHGLRLGHEVGGPEQRLDWLVLAPFGPVG